MTLSGGPRRASKVCSDHQTAVSARSHAAPLAASPITPPCAIRAVRRLADRRPTPPAAAPQTRSGRTARARPRRTSTCVAAACLRRAPAVLLEEQPRAVARRDPHLLVDQQLLRDQRLICVANLELNDLCFLPAGAVVGDAAPTASPLRFSPAGGDSGGAATGGAVRTMPLATVVPAMRLSADAPSRVRAARETSRRPPWRAPGRRWSGRGGAGIRRAAPLHQARSA